MERAGGGGGGGGGSIEFSTMFILCTCVVKMYMYC